MLETRIKTKKIQRVLEFNHSQWLKLHIELNTEKSIEAEKNGGKDGKAFYKLMNNAIYGEKMENLRNKMHVKLVKS